MDYLLDLFAAYPLYYFILTFILGLCIGSFLNVVIIRYPKVMLREWRDECIEFFKLSEATIPAAERASLLWPRSHCTLCKTTIKVSHNIPVISFLWLKGQCASCGERVSWRYPIIEFLTAILSVIVAWKFGVEWKTFYALIFTWILIAIAGIDWDHQLIPDVLSLSLLWLGLLINLNDTFTPLSSAVIGAIIGYASLWLFMHGFKLVTGKIGMGHGDFKLVAAFGAWMGWQMLPFIIVLASLIGTIVGVGLILFKRIHRDNPIPFGPYLAIAGWAGLCWGQTILNTYLELIGL